MSASGLRMASLILYKLYEPMLDQVTKDLAQGIVYESDPPRLRQSREGAERHLISALGIIRNLPSELQQRPFEAVANQAWLNRSFAVLAEVIPHLTSEALRKYFASRLPKDSPEGKDQKAVYA